MNLLRISNVVFFLFCFQFINAQFPGKKTKNPYLSIDGHTYKVNEVLKVNFPSKGTNYQSIYLYKHDDALDSTSKFLSVLSGDEASKTDIKLADKEINNFSGKILYFKIFKTKGDPITYAIVDYKNKYRLAIPIDLAVYFKEILSNNPEYLNKNEASNLAVSASNELNVKSFNSNFSLKLISAEGNINDQTVELTYLVSHKMVHQKVCLAEGNKSKLFDYNGNEYNAKKVIVANNNNESQYLFSIESRVECNKIPTNVPVKLKVIFNKVLPSNKEFSYSESQVLFKDFEDYNYNSGNIEVNNLKVEWK